MLKNKFLIFGLMVLVGLGSGVAIMASAQSATTPTTPVVTSTNTAVKTEAVDTPEVGDVPDVTGLHTDKAGDKDGDPASEASEGAGSSDAGE
jgi:hypothetical protein